MYQKLLFFLLSLSFAFPSFAGWSAWDYLGGTLTSDPAACTGGNITFVFARGTDNRTYFRKRNLPTGVWGPWKKMPNIMSGNQEIKATGAPAAVCRSSSINAQAYVQVVGTDRRIWNTYIFGTADREYLGPWTQTPGFFAAYLSSTALAGWNLNPIYSFAKGADNRMYTQTYFNGTVTPFEILVPEQTINSPAAVMSNIDRVDFFYRDQSGRLWQKFKFGTIWNPTSQQIPGVTYGSPEVVSRDISSLDLFTRGPNNSLYHKRSINGVWGNWISLGGLVTNSPGATTYANNARIFVFVRWTDGTLRYRAWAP